VFRYMIIAVIAMLLAGCTGKDKIPPMPPEHTKTEIDIKRTQEEMQRKLERIRMRKPIQGDELSSQKQNARKEIDTLLHEAKAYKGEISRFENAQLLALRKVKKIHKIRHKKRKLDPNKKLTEKETQTIDMVKEYENRLKYY